MYKDVHCIETRQPFVDDSNDLESEDDGLDFSEEPQIVSFRDAKYESSEMKQLLSLTEPDETMPPGSDDVTYKSSKVFPDWVLKNSNWKTTAKLNEEAHTVSDILKMDKTKRNPDQNALVIKWLMSVWKIAFTMGFKRCGSMLKAFEYISYAPGEHIIEEGKRGLTFYIIISGDTHVHKEGIGIVGQLGQGKSFGEVALTQGNDLRTATVTAVTNVECVRLHKSSFDYYVRDIQDQEKRENFKVLSDCKLFKTWPKGKIEKMSNSCVRRILDAGDYVFRQGDPPLDLCIIVEGNVNIVKELVIVCKNRWPVGINEWKERTKKINKPILLKTLSMSDFFGEVAILKEQPRSTSAIAANRCVLLSLDRLEFLHLISYGNSSVNGSSIDEEDKRFNEIISKYINDQDVLDSVTYFRGGPDSQAVVGEKSVYKHDLERTKDGKRRAPPAGASKSVVIVGPTTHNTEHKQNYHKKPNPSPIIPSPGQTTIPTGASNTDSHITAATADVDMNLSLHEQLQNKKDNLTEKLRKTASQSVENERIRIDKLRAMGVGVPAAATNIVIPGRKYSTVTSTTTTPTAAAMNKKFRKGSMIDQNGLMYKKAAAVTPTAAARRGSLSFGGRRSSLQGVDNDPTFVYDPVVLLSKNSAIQLGKVYEHVQKSLQTEADNSNNDSNAGPATRGFFSSSFRGSSKKLSPLRRQSSRLAPPSTPPALNSLQLMDQWNSFIDNGGNISSTQPSPTHNTSKKLHTTHTSTAATARNSYAAFWGMDTSSSPSGGNNSTTPTTRKKSTTTVTYDRSSRNPSIFSNSHTNANGIRPASAGTIHAPPTTTGKQHQGSQYSQNPIANAIAQAIAYANATANNTNTSNSSKYNNNNNNNSNSLSYSDSNQGSFGILSTPGDISSNMHNRAPFSSKYGGGLTRTAWQEHGEQSLSSDNDDSIGFEHENYSNNMSNNGVQLSRKLSQNQLKPDTSLKLLNKSKISYRELMEG